MDQSNYFYIEKNEKTRRIPKFQMETHSFCQHVLGFIGFGRLETKNLVSTTASKVSHPPNQHMLSLKKTHGWMCRISGTPRVGTE
jgi:uncharacterized protein YcgL (UPF0745 family)